MRDETVFRLPVCDENLCDVTEGDVSVRDTTECDATAGGKAVGPVTQLPSLALTRCETSPISARP